MNLFIASAYASDAAPTANQTFASFFPFILIFFVFYFLMIRPQQKKVREEMEFNKSLKKGDEIYTKSGMLGAIVGMTEKVVTLDVGDGNKLKVLRSQVAGSSKNIFSSEAK